MMKDPIRITAKEIGRKCPTVNDQVVKYFTTMKYHARLRALNEHDLIEKKLDRKRKATEKNQLPKKVKLMRDFQKDGHYDE